MANENIQDLIKKYSQELADKVKNTQAEIPELLATSPQGYAYDADFFYTGERILQKNPFIAGEFLLPADVTTIKPPKLKPNQCVKYDVKMRTWQILPNFDGVQYYSPNGDVHICTQKGVPLPADASLTKPPPTPTQALELAILALEQINKSVILKAKLQADFSDDILILANEYKNLTSEKLEKAKNIFLKIANENETADAVVARILENEKNLILKKAELDAIKITNIKKIKNNLDQAYLVIVEHAKQLTPIYSNNQN